MPFWSLPLVSWVTCLYNNIFYQNIKYQLHFLLFLVLTHRYGRDGRDSKKFEDKSLLFDFTFLQSIVDKAFVHDYMQELNTFVNFLNNPPKTGKCSTCCLTKKIYL